MVVNHFFLATTGASHTRTQDCLVHSWTASKICLCDLQEKELIKGSHDLQFLYNKMILSINYHLLATNTKQNMFCRWELVT